MLIKEKHEIISLERLKKRINGAWVPSESLKITFREKILPRAVVIGHSYYKIRPFVHPPVQCFNCQRVGHTAQGCRARTRCLVCGENHNKEVCQAVIEKCANCTGSHKKKLEVLSQNAECFGSRKT